MPSSRYAPEPDSWRELAEARLGELGEASSHGLGEALRAVHELRVHQVELELQNEALREARLEAELSWELYRELYDFAPVGYFTLNPSGVILQVNHAGSRLVKAERVHLVNRRFAQFLSPGDRIGFAAFLQQGLASSEPLACEVSLSGEGLPSLRIRLESSSGGSGEHLRMVAVDITELRAAEAQVKSLNHELEARVARRTAELQLANNEMQAFCHMISHELRAPLARLEGFSRKLLRLVKEPGTDRIAHVAARIEVSSLRMREVIDSLLLMTRLTLEKLAPGPVDLSALAREIMATLAREGRPVPARICITEGLCAVGDPRLLAIGLRNLLENAVKFSARTENAMVEFGVSYHGGRPAYFVKDNGAGFDPAHAGKLFQAFERLHPQEDFEGTGLGLSIVHKIIAKHGGRIWGEAAPGAGATFFFTLEQGHGGARAES